MFKFLFFCIFFFLFYLGFIFLGEFNTKVEFFVFDYKVQTTLFILIAGFFITQFVLTIILKAVFFLINLPNFLKSIRQKKKLQNINKKLLKIVAEFLIKNPPSVDQIARNIVPELDKTDRDVGYLLEAESNISPDKKIEHYRKLIGNKNFNLHALKRLAEIFHKEGHYVQAEEFALRAFNENDTDKELLLILIKIYASLNLWPKLVFIVSKLKRADSKYIRNKASEISAYYFSAAKYYLQAGLGDESKKYLEYALEIKPDRIDALILFTELQINTGNNVLINKILKTAFSLNPDFQIARLIADNMQETPEIIYDMLAEIVPPINNQALFLAIAAYLGLDDKINALKKIA